MKTRRFTNAVRRPALAAIAAIAAVSTLAGCSPSPAESPSVTAPTSTATFSPGKTRIDPRGVEQVWVPAGSFRMGSDAADIGKLKASDFPGFVQAQFAYEQPAHEVRLTKGYWLDIYEATNGSFQAFVDAGGYKNRTYWSEAGWQWLSGQFVDQLPQFCQENLPDYPRVCVTWYEAEAYAAWRGGRLPTEAEWEYAARGPDSLVYPWGNEFDPLRGNILDSKGLKPVGSYPSGVSWIGAYDMAGNAMEWVQDWLGTAYYGQSPAEDPAGPADVQIKVEKGGWWGSNPAITRSAHRHFTDPPDYGDHHIGFRIVSD